MNYSTSNSNVTYLYSNSRRNAGQRRVWCGGQLSDHSSVSMRTMEFWDGRSSNRRPWYLVGCWLDSPVLSCPGSWSCRGAFVWDWTATLCNQRHAMHSKRTMGACILHVQSEREGRTTDSRSLLSGLIPHCIQIFNSEATRLTLNEKHARNKLQSTHK